MGLTICDRKKYSLCILPSTLKILVNLPQFNWSLVAINISHSFQTLKLSCGEQDLFVNKAAGGSELLRLVSKTTHKDTAERMVAEMEALDKLCQDVPKQEVHLEGVGLVQVEHRLVNTLHDGKERLAMTQHKV